MNNVVATGQGQADLSLEFNTHETIKRKKGCVKHFNPFSITVRDLQSFSAEFVGTFFLALVIGTSKVDSFGAAPYAIGFTLVALVYTTGPISGGQLNPAVTIGLYVRGKLKLFEAFYCCMSQLLGAIIAGLVTYSLYDHHWNDVGHPAVSDTNRRPQAFVAEMLQSFCLVSVVLNTATTKQQANNSYFGIAIGFVVLSGALVVGGMSGACFNPAVSMLTLLVGEFDDIWVFFMGPLIGGLFAGLAFRITNPAEFEADTDALSVKKVDLESKELSDSDFNEELSRPSFGHHNPDGNRSRTAAMLTQEFIGTFFLSWTAALSVDAENPLGGVLAVGAIITSVAYAGGAISGAHYNPAVTASVYLRGLRETPQAMRDTDAIYYIVVQFAAAFAASGAALWVQDNEVQSIACPQVAEHGHSIFGELSAEFLFTYLLLLCVLNVGTAKAVAGNSYFGIAIGFVIIGAQICVSDISGSVLNPAVALALPVVGACSTKDVWIFIIAEMAAAPFAAATFLFWHLEVGDPVVERPSEDNDGLEETDVGVARGEPSSKSVHWTDGSDASPLWTLQVNSSN